MAVVVLALLCAAPRSAQSLPRASLAFVGAACRKVYECRCKAEETKWGSSACAFGTPNGKAQRMPGMYLSSQQRCSPDL